MLMKMLKREPLRMAGELALASNMVEVGNWTEASMVVGILNQADMTREAIEACVR